MEVQQGEGEQLKFTKYMMCTNWPVILNVNVTVEMTFPAELATKAFMLTTIYVGS